MTRSSIKRAVCCCCMHLSDICVWRADDVDDGICLLSVSWRHRVSSCLQSCMTCLLGLVCACNHAVVLCPALLNASFHCMCACHVILTGLCDECMILPNSDCQLIRIYPTIDQWHPSIRVVGSASVSKSKLAFNDVDRGGTAGSPGPCCVWLYVCWCRHSAELLARASNAARSLCTFTLLRCSRKQSKPCSKFIRGTAPAAATSSGIAGANSSYLATVPNDNCRHRYPINKTWQQKQLDGGIHT
jgi:hypothetical protein